MSFPRPESTSSAKLDVHLVHTLSDNDALGNYRSPSLLRLLKLIGETHHSPQGGSPLRTQPSLTQAQPLALTDPFSGSGSDAREPDDTRNNEYKDSCSPLFNEWAP